MAVRPKIDMPGKVAATTDTTPAAPSRKQRTAAQRSTARSTDLQQEAEQSANMNRESDANLQKSPDTIFGLQQTVGNRAVQSLLNGLSGPVHRIINEEDARNGPGGAKSAPEDNSLLRDSDTANIHEVKRNSDNTDGITAPDAGPEFSLLKPDRVAREAQGHSELTTTERPQNRRATGALRITLDDDFHNVNQIQDKINLGLRSQAEKDLHELQSHVDDKYTPDATNELMQAEPKVAQDILFLQAQIGKLLEKTAGGKLGARRPGKPAPPQSNADDNK